MTGEYTENSHDSKQECWKKFEILTLQSFQLEKKGGIFEGHGKD